MSTSTCMIDYPRNLRSRDRVKFGEITDNIWQTVQATRQTQLKWKTNRKAYVAYRMASIKVTFKVICLLQVFYVRFFVQWCSSLQDFN